MAILDLSRAPHGGQVKLLPENATEPRITPRLIILHSIVGDAERTWNYFRDGTNLESTFIVAGRWDRLTWPDGYIVQAMDTTREADANYHANPFAISIETEDDGTPDDTPWTVKQMDALAWLVAECARIHRIPLRRADAWDGSGVGYHTQWGAPSPWTPVVKTCPGRVRIQQVPTVLDRARAIAAGGEGGISLAGADDILEALRKLRQDMTVFGTHGLEQTVEDFATRQRDTLAKLDEIEAKVGADSGRIDTLAAAVVAMGNEVKALREQLAALPGGTAPAPSLDGNYTATIALARIEG